MLKHSQAAPPLRTLDWVSPPQFEWLLEEFKGDLSLVAMEMRSERQGPFEYWDLRRLWYALIEGASGSHSHPNIGQAPPKMHGLPLLASTAPCRLSLLCVFCLLLLFPIPFSPHSIPLYRPLAFSEWFSVSNLFDGCCSAYEMQQSEVLMLEQEESELELAIATSEYIMG